MALCLVYSIKPSTAYWGKECKCSNCRLYKYEVDKKYREKNKDRLKLKRQEKRQNSPEIVKEWKRRDYLKHRDAYIARSRKHQKTDKYKMIHKNTKLKMRYKLSVEQRDQMLKEQNGLCAICWVNPAVYVDHDHSNGKVRALLCQGCNLGIGFLKDDLNIIFSAMEYLKFHTSNAPVNKK